MAALFLSPGLLWGISFFGKIGEEFGYSWTLFGYSMLGGLAFSVLFCLFLMLVFRINKKIEKRKHLRSQRTLEKACAPFMHDGIFTIDGQRTYATLKTKMQFVTWHCRLFVYDDYFKLISAYGKKTETLDIPFDEIAYLRARKYYFSIQKHKHDGIYLSIEDENLRLLSALKEKNLPFLCEKMFLNYHERKGDEYFEFQYRRKDYEPNEEVQKNSLFLFWEDEQLFTEIYEPYFNAMNVLTGNENPFDFFSEAEISKEQTEILLQEIQKHQPEGYEIFAPWLEKASTEYNGFYMLGIA